MAGLNIVALEEAPQVPETSICAAYYDSWRARKLLNKLSSLSCGRVLGPKYRGGEAGLTKNLFKF
jgi:hypothetical protein